MISMLQSMNGWKNVALKLRSRRTIQKWQMCHCWPSFTSCPLKDCPSCMHGSGSCRTCFTMALNHGAKSSRWNPWLIQRPLENHLSMERWSQWKVWDDWAWFCGLWSRPTTQKTSLKMRISGPISWGGIVHPIMWNYRINNVGPTLSI